MRPRRQQPVITQPSKQRVVGRRDVKVKPRGETARHTLKGGGRNICIIRSVGGLGDVLMSTPALRELKRRFPEAHLTYAVDRHRTFDDSYYELVKNAPFIDAIIDARYVVRAKYDKVVDISAVCLPYERTGLPPINRIDLFAKALGFGRIEDRLPFYKVEECEIAWARKLVGCADSPIVGLHTASHDKKRSLPLKTYFEIIRGLNERLPGVRIVLFDFNNRDERLASLPGVIDCSKYPTRQKAALINECSVFFGPDSGLMHLAGALKIPSVVAFGSIPPEARINHYPSHEAITTDISCKPCWYKDCPRGFKCMEQMDSGSVINRIVSKIQSFPSQILFHSILNPCDGYGGSAEQIALSLDSAQLSLRYSAYSSSGDWKRLAEPRTIALQQRCGRGFAYLGYYPPELGQKLPEVALRARKRFIYTTFESTKPPLDWTGYINQFDKLFVSCKMCRDGFAGRGVNIPISIVPLGVKEELWPLRHRTSTGPFCFLLFANAQMSDTRKNYMAAYKAFKQAFGNSTAVKLIIKISGGSVPSAIASQPNVSVVSGRFTQKELYSLVSKADVLLVPSRGEGYNLPLRECMATGMPVVATDFGGHESAMATGLNYSIPYKMVRASYPDGLYVDRNRGSSDFGLWAEPSVSGMAKVIANLPTSLKEVRERGEAGAEWVRQNETYEIAASRLRKEMGL